MSNQDTIPMPTMAIDARAFSGPDVFTGYTTYLTSVVEPLLAAGFKITLLSNRPILPEHTIAKKCQVAVFGRTEHGLGSKFNIGTWEQFDVPKYLGQHHFDIYFAPSNRGIPWKKRKDTRYVAAILDVIPFLYKWYYFTRYKFHFLRKEYLPFRIAVWRADQVVTISKACAKDIAKILHRKDVVALPFNVAKAPDFKKPAIKKQFVYIGGENPRKRVDVLLKAFAQFKTNHPDYRLVLVGRAYEPYVELIQELGINDAVTVTGYVSEVQKFEYLASSVALVYPSLYEGYGLEAAEAMQAGTPIIAGAGGAQKEVGGNATLYIDPNSIDSIIKAMEQVLLPEVAAKLIAAGQQQLTRIQGVKITAANVDYFKQQVEISRGEQ